MNFKKSLYNTYKIKTNKFNYKNNILYNFIIQLIISRIMS